MSQNYIGMFSCFVFFFFFVLCVCYFCYFFFFFFRRLLNIKITKYKHSQKALSTPGTLSVKANSCVYLVQGLVRACPDKHKQAFLQTFLL